MKKIFAAAVGLLLLALNASADSIGVANLNIAGSSPNVTVTLNGTRYWAGDYDIIAGSNNLVNLGLKLNSHEVFCTENANLIQALTPYAFYRIDSTLKTNYSGGDPAYLAKLTEATWLANSGYDGNENQKAISQLAIWNVMFGAVAQTFSTEVGNLLDSYNNATTTIQNKYVNDWLLAVSPATTSGEIEIGRDGQNFLVKASPVPEPATMLLFGAGVAGLAAVVRRKRS